MKALTWLEPILINRSPLEPLPTHVTPELKKLRDVRAVVFDVYGTLIVSGSGDVGSVDETDRSLVMGRALAEAGVQDFVLNEISWNGLRCVISQMNQVRSNEHCVSPEVDIIAAWRDLLDSNGWSVSDQAISDVVRLATRFESMANPTWPMPGAADLIQQLHSREICLGIVSNAQVFTTLLVDDLTIPKKNNEPVFQHDLCFFSNRFRHSKPGPRMFDALAQSLQRRNILPQEAIYVGNDMLNDVWAAKQIGMRTAWYAGDRRSARRREEDSRCGELSADLILTSLPQLLECLTLE